MEAENVGSDGPAKKFRQPSRAKISSACSINDATGAKTKTSL